MMGGSVFVQLDGSILVQTLFDSVLCCMASHVVALHPAFPLGDVDWASVLL